jgi:hypothetical protein
MDLRPLLHPLHHRRHPLDHTPQQPFGTPHLVLRSPARRQPRHRALSFLDYHDHLRTHQEANSPRYVARRLLCRSDGCSSMVAIQVFPKEPCPVVYHPRTFFFPSSSRKAPNVLTPTPPLVDFLLLPSHHHFVPSLVLEPTQQAPRCCCCCRNYRGGEGAVRRVRMARGALCRRRRQGQARPRREAIPRSHRL